MPLPFRQRIFVILVALTAVPTALAVVGWALAVRTVAPSAGARVALEEVAASARLMVDRMDTTHLSARERAAFREHLEQLSNSVTLARRAETYLRYYAGGVGARRVAHEIKNPLTAMRIAVDQLRRSGGPVERRTDVAVEVIGAETERLDQLAKEFAEFGRLPEGPRSEVDLVDLLMDLGKSAVPSEVDVSVRANGESCKLLGHYDPLRRAFANLLRNAAEAMGGRGAIEIAVSRDGAGLAVTVADHGAGIPDDLRQRVFEPYFTTKHDGTGLGLALVRQTIEAHNGSITVAETPGGGATFSIVLTAA